jgi:N-acyl homoserine lactone hydrolase
MRDAPALLPAGDVVVRLTVLDFGLFDVGPGRRIIGIPGFLIETRSGARILVDTGFPPAYATAPEATAARDDLPRFGRLIGYSARQTAEGQLAVLGLSPADIAFTILTHGHIDHVGSLPLLAHAPIVMTRTERADPQPCYFFDKRPMDWPDAPYILIDGDAGLCAGLTLIPTPGHTAGHLSVLVTLPETGPVILAGDAINRPSEPDEGYPDARDPALAAQSGDRLLALRDRTGAMLVYGHCPVQWRGLRKAPEYYG